MKTSYVVWGFLFELMKLVFTKFHSFEFSYLIKNLSFNNDHTRPNWHLQHHRQKPNRY